MIKSKERVLNHLYNRTIYEEKVRKKAMEVKGHLDNFMENELNRPPTPNEFEGITTDITLGEAAKLSAAASLRFNPAYSELRTGERFGKTQEFKLATAEETEFKEVYDAQFKEVPIWTFYEYLRAYHVIEIIIGFLITIGVYVWLK